MNNRILYRNRSSRRSIIHCRSVYPHLNLIYPPTDRWMWININWIWRTWDDTTLPRTGRQQCEYSSAKMNTSQPPNFICLSFQHNEFNQPPMWSTAKPCSLLWQTRKIHSICAPTMKTLKTSTNAGGLSQIQLIGLSKFQLNMRANRLIRTFTLLAISPRFGSGFH